MTAGAAMTHPTDDSLKPCPFCGGAASLHPRTCDKNTPYNPADRAFPIARCGQCGAEAVGKDWGKPETAAEKWNTRALLAEQARTEPTQEFESAQGRALASAWAEGWAQCRDAEYVGEEAESEAFNQSNTLAQCLYADQTRFQGGLSNDQLRRAWSAKLPNVIPTDEQLTAFALGIEAAAQPLKAEQAKDAAEDAELLEDERATEASRLITALANCRDAFPIPEHGSPLERAWAEAMADPLAVPHYIRAARAAERKAP